MDKRKQYEDALVAARPAMMRRAKKWRMGQLSEDLVQEAYLTALARSDWAEIKKPACWMLGVVDNTARNWRRRMANRAALLHEENIEATIDRLRNENGEKDIVDQMIEGEEIAEQIKVIMDAIQGAGLSSSEDYTVMARMRGRDYDEIAELLGIGRESAATYYSNAICKIRRKIQGETQNG